MKIVILFLLTINTLPFAIFAQTPSITNITVSQRTDGSGSVDIYYNLVGSGSVYDVSLEVSFNNGSSFASVSSAYLSGNISVTPGANRHLVWNGKGSSNNIYSTQTKVKLIAHISICGQPIIVTHIAGAVAPVNKTVSYGTVANIPGEPTKCWITSNLGSDHQAMAVNDATEASAGWYWQFNSKQGYKHTGTARTPNTTWITSINENSDWISANDPCTIELESGWRIPTYTEWYNVDNIGNWTNWNGPWNSALKLHAAGHLDYSSGSLFSRGSYGFYWSITQYDSNWGWHIGFINNISPLWHGRKANGFPLRCLKDVGSSAGQPCPGVPTVVYGGQTYNTVQIGTQCWMKENMNVGSMIQGDQWPADNGIIEKYCYENLESNCNVYGGLYLWAETMQYITTEGAQGICPSGWHIPTDGEWTALTTYLGGENVAGGKMKELGYSHWQNPNTDATNESGFYALPGGRNDKFNGNFSAMGQNIFLWSSSEELNYSVNAWILSPDYNSANVNRLNSSKYSGNSVRCLKGEAIPTVSTTSVSSINQTSATSGGNVTHDGGATVTARGICWSTSPNPSIANSHTTNGTGTGFFVSSLTGLTPVTLYYVRAYATNIAGTAYGNQVIFTTSSGLPCGSSININHVAGIVAPVTKTVNYGIVTNIPGEPSKCWITSNLGADHQATAVDDATEASAGWYWQFNRKQGYKHDGTTRTPNTTWITAINENLDWQSANDPCVLELGNGWRIPSKSEWENVDMSGNWSDWTGPWNSGLKLHAAGYLQNTDGSMDARGSGGQYLSATQISAENSQFLYFSNGYCEFASTYKSYAFSLRCLRD